MAGGDAGHVDEPPDGRPDGSTEESPDERPEDRTEGSEGPPEPREDPPEPPDAAPAREPARASAREPGKLPVARRRRPGRLLRTSTTGLVLFVLALATASYFFDLGPRLGLAGPSPISEPARVPPPAGLTLPASARVTEVAARTPPEQVNPAAVRRALARLVHATRLGKRVAVDVNQLSDGTPVFGFGAHRVIPASTMKLLTTTAALEALGPQHRFTTKVVTGAGPRDIVLVGGGDPLLEPGPASQPSTAYPARADLQTLAAAAARSLKDIGRTTVRLRYDASLFTGPAVNRHWPKSYIRDNVVSPISALWVNEGRTQGTAEQAPRSAHPASFAARLFATDLAQHGIKVLGHPRAGTAPAKPDTLGSVQSAPLAQIVEHILEVSDNEGAEVLARQVAIAEGMPATFAGGARAVRHVLSGLGIDTSADTTYDGSGLSRQDRVTPASLLAVLDADAQPGHGQLRPLITSLPVAGFTGTLAYRFQDAPRAGLGVVRAKTGTLTGVSGLAGVVTTRDGAVLDFVAIANRYKPNDTMWVRDRLDQIGAALASCACSSSTATASSTP